MTTRSNETPARTAARTAARNAAQASGRRPRDEGSALIIVLATMTVLTLFVSVALTHAMRTSDTAQRATAWNQAFAAAEAGVDDYLARLIANDGYWRSIDCTNPALKGRTTRANTCGWGTSTPPGWLGVPGSSRAQFHLDVDVSATPINGTIDLISTGRVTSGASAGVTRTIQVTLRRGGFGEFLYYTDYETKDPADYPNPTTAAAKCRRHYWETPQRDLSYCEDIQFVSGDRLDGPVHSNDAMVIGGSTTFTGTVTTSLPACRTTSGTPPASTKCYRRVNSANPTFQKGIAYRSPVDMPDSIGDLRQYVDPARTSNPGCLYTGPTRIVLNAPNNGPATMTVWSRWSTSIPNPACGNPAAPWPQTVPVPDNNLIMVQDVPSGQAQPVSGPCPTGSIGDGYPVANDFVQTQWDANCRFGTVLVEGVLKGRLTISADNNIVVTDDLTYAGGDNGTDVLGLVAENSVQIYHPVGRQCLWGWGGTCWSWSQSQDDLKGPDGTFNTSPKLNAAVLSLQHSFEVQAYDVGSPQGSLHLYGAIAQRFRGIVGTGSGNSSTGYLKDYHYDSRLRYAPPPYFLDPVRSGWGQKTFGEIQGRYGG